MRLEWYEFAGAVQVGLARFITSEASKMNNASTYKRNWLERLEQEVIGASAERLACKWLKTYWDGSVNTFHNEPDIRKGEHEIEVRSTKQENGSLILRDNDADDRLYVLVVGSPPEQRIVGWIRGSDGKREEFKRDPHGHRLAYFVPQSALESATKREAA